MSESTAVEQAPAPVTSTPTTPTVRTRLRSLRLPAILVALLLVLAVVAALVSSRGVGTLDIDSYSKTGSHAVAAVLRDRGVDVRQVRLLDEAAATSGGTLVVVGSDLLDAGALDRLAASGASTVVLVEATSTEATEAFAPGTEVVRLVDIGAAEPSCDLPAAVAAGRADAGGVIYGVSPSAPGATDASRCYPTGGEPSLVDIRPTAERHVVLLGNAEPLLNERFGDEGNASLALNLLGSDGDVTWYLPSLDDLFGQGGGPSEGRSVTDLVPRGLVGGLVWAAIVVALLALWRARRLGAVVDEPLPVVVRASETDEGRARLYRRGSNRDRAAALLRAATRDRLAPLLGLPAGTDRAALVQAVSARSSRAPDEVDALLYGAAPHDDARLVQLADELDRLDREVHGP